MWYNLTKKKSNNLLWNMTLWGFWKPSVRQRMVLLLLYTFMFYFLLLECLQLLLHKVLVGGSNSTNNGNENVWFWFWTVNAHESRNIQRMEEDKDQVSVGMFKGPICGFHSLNNVQHLRPPQASSRPSMGVGRRETQKWSIEVSVTPTRSRSPSGGCVTFRTARSLSECLLL